jgi:hypothetical protein
VERTRGVNLLPPDWNRGYSSGWYWILALIAAYEFWALLDRNDNTPPLTHVMVAEVPPWVLLPFCIWLAVHFSVRYYAGIAWYWEIVLTVLAFVATFWKG